MADKSWKAVERRVAALARGKRIPVTGEREGADVESDRWCYQVKTRKTLPTWLWTWLAGIAGNAMRKQKHGALVLKRPGDRLMTHGLVVIRFADWVQHLDAEAAKLDPIDVTVIPY